MKKKYQKVADAVRKVANELDEAGRARLEEIATALEELAGEADETGRDQISERLAEVQAKIAELDEVVADKVRAAFAKLTPAVQNVADKFTPAVRNAIILAGMKARTADEKVANMMDAAEKAGIKVRRTKNDIEGLTFGELVDYTLQIKQEDNDEIFAEFAETKFDKFFVIDLDADTAENIAKRWQGLGVNVTEKEIQQMAAQGKTITLQEIYKRQRIPNSVLDEVEEHGQAVEFESEVRGELRKAVQGLAVRAALVGDTVNADGANVTSFETIGTKTASDIFTTIVNPAGATIDLLDMRKAADAVKYDYKIAIMTGDTKRALSVRKYSSTATPILLTDAELAEQIGVNKIYTRDFIGDVEGLHAIVLNPREYRVKIRKERDVVFPQWEKNVMNYLYEKNMGGAIRGVQSTAVLRSAGE